MFSDKIKALRKKFGYSQAELAAKLNITQQAVGKWETGRSEPDHDTLMSLALLFETTTDYILGYATPSATSFISRFLEAGEHPIPVIGTVKAGYGALAFEEDYGIEYARVKNPEEHFFLIVKGDSMEPRIQNGDYALVRKQPTLEDGELGVFVYGEGEGTLKKYIKKGNTIILQPFNNAYEPQVITGEDLGNLNIVGKVVETKAKW